MEQTLVLNATYEPLRIVSWQKAITMLFQGKVEVIAVYDREIRGVTVRVKLPSVLRLLRHDPFGGERPRFVRALLYRYRFTTPAEHRATGAWWHRELIGDYLPPVTLRRLERS